MLSDWLTEVLCSHRSEAGIYLLRHINVHLMIVGAWAWNIKRKNQTDMHAPQSKYFVFCSRVSVHSAQKCHLNKHSGRIFSMTKTGHDRSTGCRPWPELWTILTMSREQKTKSFPTVLELKCFVTNIRKNVDGRFSHTVCHLCLLVYEQTVTTCAWHTHINDHSYTYGFINRTHRFITVKPCLVARLQLPQETGLLGSQAMIVALTLPGTSFTRRHVHGEPIMASQWRFQTSVDYVRNKQKWM